jgi:hypothetical protein
MLAPTLLAIPQPRPFNATDACHSSAPHLLLVLRHEGRSLTRATSDCVSHRSAQLHFVPLASGRRLSAFNFQ